MTIKARLQFDKEYIVSKYGMVKMGEWPIDVPDAVHCVIASIPARFQYVVELEGPDDDVAKVLHELMDRTPRSDVQPVHDDHTEVDTAGAVGSES